MKYMHEWNMSPKDAIGIQEKMRAKINITPYKGKIRFIAGADVSLNLYSKTVYAGFVIMKYPELEIVETQVVKNHTNFPYIPGLLSFREIPSLLKAWKKVKCKPDLIVVDGAGIAHPRRMGIATHLGIVLDIPTIGCAKSRLTGKTNALVGVEAGNAVPLFASEAKEKDLSHSEMIGYVFRSKKNSNPLYVSPGYKCSIEQSLEIIRKCLRGYRLPEPTRQTHLAVNAFRIAHMHKE